MKKAEPLLAGDMIRESLFDRCRAIDVSDIIETKGSVKFISWANCWERVKINFPEAIFEIHEFGPINRTVQKDHWKETDYDLPKVPYLSTDFGVFVRVTVTIEGVKQTCTLPIMDHNGKSLSEPDSRDINDNTWRCLVKACALHGIGIECYQKEDIYNRKNAGFEKPDEPDNESYSFDDVLIAAKDRAVTYGYMGKVKPLKTFEQWGPKEIEKSRKWILANGKQNTDSAKDFLRHAEEYLKNLGQSSYMESS